MVAFYNNEYIDPAKNTFLEDQIQTIGISFRARHRKDGSFLAILNLEKF